MDGSLGKSKRWRVPMVAATIAILVAACGNTAPSSETPKNGGTLIWALDSDATTLNPFVASTLPEFRVISFLFPNLYAGDKNLNVVPDLADGMPSVSSDGLVLTLTLERNAKWMPGQEFDLSANPNYYNGRPHYDKVIGKVITDATAAANALINGDVAWHPSLGESGAGGISKAKKSSNVQVHSYQDLGYIDFRMNTRKGHIFDNVLTRQALASVLDKPSIVQAATQGAGAPLWGDIVPASWAYDANSVVKYPLDVNKAKSLMQQAGWTIGSDGVATRTLADGCSACSPVIKAGGQQKFVGKIRVRAGKPDRLKAAEIIADQVKQIGMQLTPDPTDFKVFYKPVQTGQFDVFIAGFSLTLEPDDYSTAHSSQLHPEHHEGQNWTA